jgi:hypothetical protein
MSMVRLSEDIVTLMRKSRLRWYGHVMRRDEEVGIRRVLEFEVAGEIGRGRPPMGWKEQVEKDMVKAGLQRDDAQVRVAWRRGVSGLFSSADEREPPISGKMASKRLCVCVIISTRLDTVQALLGNLMSKLLDEIIGIQVIFFNMNAASSILAALSFPVHF